MPLLYGKTVTIGGVRYVDGALTVSVETMISKAEMLGATHYNCYRKPNG